MAAILGELKASVSLSSGVTRDPVYRLAVEAEGAVVGAEARGGEVVQPFDVSVVPELLLRSWEKWHNSHSGTWGAGGRKRAFGPRWRGGRKQAGQSTVRQPGPVSEELTPPRPGWDPGPGSSFQMNSTHRNRKQDTV